MRGEAKDGHYVCNGLISREVTLGNGTRARCVGNACGFGPNRRDCGTKAERIVLSKKSSNFLRIFARRGIPRERKFSKWFFDSLPVLSVRLQAFPILLLGAKRDLPLFSVIIVSFGFFRFDGTRNGTRNGTRENRRRRSLRCALNQLSI